VNAGPVTGGRLLIGNRLGDGKILLSQQAWVVKVSCPLFMACGCFFIVSQATKETLIANFCIALPLAAMALWCLFVPAEVYAVEGTLAVTIIRWTTSISIPFEEIAFIKRRLSIFDTLVLKSGKTILYISTSKNRHLLVGSPLVAMR
jgi:hypothetical protein